MRPAKIILLALAAAALTSCERAAVPVGEGEPQSLRAPASNPAPPNPEASGASAPSTPPELRHPAPQAVSDAFITGAVRASLLGDPGLEGSDVSVNTSHGVVSLTGRVKSREQAAIAAAHAEGEDGVMRVSNTLVVLND